MLLAGRAEQLEVPGLHPAVRGLSHRDLRHGSRHRWLRSWGHELRQQPRAQIGIPDPNAATIPIAVGHQPAGAVRATDGADASLRDPRSVGNRDQVIGMDGGLSAPTHSSHIREEDVIDLCDQVEQQDPDLIEGGAPRGSQERVREISTLGRTELLEVDA